MLKSLLHLGFILLIIDLGSCKVLTRERRNNIIASDDPKPESHNLVASENKAIKRHPDPNDGEDEPPPPPEPSKAIETDANNEPVVEASSAKPKDVPAEEKPAPPQANESVEEPEDDGFDDTKARDVLSCPHFIDFLEGSRTIWEGLSGVSNLKQKYNVAKIALKDALDSMGKCFFNIGKEINNFLRENAVNYFNGNAKFSPKPKKKKKKKVSKKRAEKAEKADSSKRAAPQNGEVLPKEEEKPIEQSIALPPIEFTIVPQNEGEKAKIESQPEKKEKEEETTHPTKIEVEIVPPKITVENTTMSKHEEYTTAAPDG